MSMTTRRIIAQQLWPHCLAVAILIFSISFRELVGSVLLRPPGMQTVATFIFREFDQGSPASDMAMGVIAITVSILSVSLARRLVPKKFCPPTSRRPDSRRGQATSKAAQTPTWSEGQRSGLSLAGWLKHRPEARTFIFAETQT